MPLNCILKYRIFGNQSTVINWENTYLMTMIGQPPEHYLLIFTALKGDLNFKVYAIFLNFPHLAKIYNIHDLQSGNCCLVPFKVVQWGSFSIPFIFKFSAGQQSWRKLFWVCQTKQVTRNGLETYMPKVQGQKAPPDLPFHQTTSILVSDQMLLMWLQAHILSLQKCFLNFPHHV